MTHNPVRGVKRPKADANEAKTPAIGDAQARAILEAPAVNTLKGKRDRAILATFLFHGPRCEEVCGLRFVPPHTAALERIAICSGAAGHGDDLVGPLFRPMKNSRPNATLRKPICPDSINKSIVKHYGKKAGVDYRRQHTSSL